MKEMEALRAQFGDDACRVPPLPSAWTQWNGVETARPDALLVPESTATLQKMIRHCIGAGVAMVPQGGGTGLSGGGWATGREDRPVAAISLAKMKKVRSFDPVDRMITVEAGFKLAEVDDVARSSGLTFPLWFGASGTAQVGGAVSTNAGGLRSWRHGTMRDLVVGLEAVFADGTLWEGTRKVRKQTAGPDVSHLLIGSEGILGIVTAATLRLAVPFTRHATVFLALNRVADAVELLRRFEAAGALEVIELMSGTGIRHFVRAEGAAALPCSEGFPWYLMAEWGTHTDDLTEGVEASLEAAIAEGLIADGSLARSEADRARFWAVRERHGAACRRAGRPLQHDIAVPVSCLPAFIETAMKEVACVSPDLEAVPVCHLGDGNVHFDLLVPAGGAPSDLAALSARIHDLAVSFGGTFSAEHGIGTQKRDELARLVPNGNLAIMRAIKSTLDPAGLMNPGKVL